MIGPLVIGHRGMGVLDKESKYAENSIEGFRAALHAGADGIELDLQLSADGEAIVHHDSRLGRATTVAEKDGTGVVARLSHEQLEEVELKNGEGETIPSLPQVLEAVGSELSERELWVELKSQRGDEAGERLVRRVVEVLSANSVWPRTWFISFDQRLLSVARELAPDTKLLLIAMLRVHRTVRLAAEMQFEAVGVYHRLATGSALHRARRSDLKVGVGILETERQIRRFAKDDVDYLVTDQPALASALR